MRQKNEIKKEQTYLNYATIIKYAVSLFSYFSPDKLAKHIYKMCLFSFSNFLLVCPLQS